MDVEVVKLRTPFPNPDHTYVYVVNDEIMVDGGFSNPENAEKLEDFKVNRIIITHHHIDHVGLIFYGKKKVETHRKEMEFLEIYTKPEKFIEDYKRLLRAYGVNERYAATLKIVSALKLSPNAKITELKEELVVETPGHTAGHVSVLIENCLFSGDFILSNTTPNISFHPNYTSGVKDYIFSLRKVLKLDIVEIFPAHERRIKNPEKRIHELLYHCEKRAAEIYDAINSGLKNLEEVANEVGWSSGKYEKFDDFNRFMALCETLAFINHLKELGKIKEVEQDGKIEFSVC